MQAIQTDQFQAVLFSTGEYSDYRVGELLIGPSSPTVAEIEQELITRCEPVLRATRYSYEQRLRVDVPFELVPQSLLDKVRNRIPVYRPTCAIASNVDATADGTWYVLVAWERNWSEIRRRLEAEGLDLSHLPQESTDYWQDEEWTSPDILIAYMKQRYGFVEMSYTEQHTE